MLCIYHCLGYPHCVTKPYSSDSTMGIQIIILVSLALIAMVSADCSAPYNTISGPHSFCQTPSSNLVQTIQPSASDKLAIVARHNFHRAAEDANDMLTMVWSDTIALLAEKWAQTCTWGHDLYRARDIFTQTTGDYYTVLYGTGQNMYKGSSTPTWDSVIDNWHSEKVNFTYGGMSTDQKGTVGHYTQIVWAKTFLVGCSMTRCSSSGSELTIAVCNYGPGGNVGEKFGPELFTPFKAGTKCGSCPDHCSKDKLCDCANKFCQNSGILNLATCNCDCSVDRPWLKAEDCAFDCTKATTSCPLSSYGCTMYSNVPIECPIYCGKCPAV